ncbi:hypothetical protein NUSPORA_02717 [Nucleospora cyclopteri]
MNEIDTTETPPETLLQTSPQTQKSPFNYSGSNNSSDTNETQEDSEERKTPQLPENF